MVMLVAVFLYQLAALQVLQGNIKESHRDLFFFPMIEDVAGNGFDNPVFKRFDDPYFKIMKASVGRLKMCLVFGGMKP